MIGKLIGRLLWVGLAYLIACFAAGTTFVMSIAGAAYTLSLDVAGVGFTSLVVSAILVVWAFVPAAVAITIAEIFRIQNWIFYTVIGVAVPIIAIRGLEMFEPTLDEVVVTDTMSPLFYVAPGLVAGLVYWIVAGRDAGNALNAVPDLHDQ